MKFSSMSFAMLSLLLFANVMFSQKVEIAEKIRNSEYPKDSILFEKKIIQLHNLGQNKNSLSKEDKLYLESLANYLIQNPDYSVRIVGHSSFEKKETEVNNLKKGEKRAKIVVDYLLKKGIKKSRIFSRSAGSLVPMVSNDTEEGRARNNRVEIVIFK